MVVFLPMFTDGTWSKSLSGLCALRLCPCKPPGIHVGIIQIKNTMYVCRRVEGDGLVAINW